MAAAFAHGAQRKLFHSLAWLSMAKGSFKILSDDPNTSCEAAAGQICGNQFVICKAS